MAKIQKPSKQPKPQIKDQNPDTLRRPAKFKPGAELAKNIK